MTHKLTHIDADGNAKMVDILQKPNSKKRVAIAEGSSASPLKVYRASLSGTTKGDVLSIAQLSEFAVQNEPLI